MPKRSKFFRIAVEGATCDGRTLDRNALQEMADTYVPATYTARVNMEHIRGFSADPPFNAYGDVVALKTEEVELELGGKKEKKLGLFAQVDALDNLVAVQAKGQKLFSSIELNPSFANTGKAYLQGLAVTDSPASLGTEVMQFAAGQGDKNPFAARKVEKGNFFSAAEETKIEFEDAPVPAESAGLFAAATEFFKQFSKPPVQEEQKPAPPQPANDNFAQLSTAIGEGFTRITAAVTALSAETKTDIAKLRGEHEALKTSIESTDGDKSRRPPATGTQGNFTKTDC